MAEKDIAGIRSDQELHPNDKKQKLNRLGAWLWIWCSKRRKIRQVRILDPDGIPSANHIDAAQYLFDWQPVFSKKNTDWELALSHIGDFIQKAPDHIVWKSTFLLLIDLVHARKDTGSGVDGLVYGYYKSIPENWLKKLYNLYEHLWYGGPPHSDFNISRLAMPPKGDDPDDTPVILTRSPKKVRPLNLSNTDTKHVSGMIARPLEDLASHTVASFQKGGTKNRHFVDHIIDLEAKLIRYVITAMPCAGIIALDQEAAFPSISRKYIFNVLVYMGVPPGIMHVFESLYNNCVSYICLSGRLYNGIDIQSGVKQGDPSSMTLFILGYDPILRWIAFRISPLDGHMFGMCDDLAMTVTDVSKAWD